MTDISDPKATLSPEQRAILMQRLIDRRASVPRGVGEVGRRSGGGRVLLSFGQEQLWFLEQLDPGEPTYNIPLVYRLRGGVDVGLLRRALGVVVARHESLRTTFGVVDGSPFQRIAEVGEVGWGVEDLSGVVAGDRERVAWEAAVREVSRPLDLTRGPLLRVRVLELGCDEYLLCVTVHHIVADGWSVGVMMREWSVVYEALADGREPALEPLAVQYADFAAWQREWLQGEAFERHLDYWEQRLAGVSVLELPTDRPRPAVRSSGGDVVQGRLTGALADGLRDLASARGVSLFMVLTAAFDALLARYSGQEDIAVGTTALGRERAELERLVGLFVNMVVLRTDLSGDPSFAELLERVREVTLEAYDHQEVPFEKVVERAAPMRDPSRNPLFQVGLQLLSAGTAGGALELADVEVHTLTPQVQRSRFDLSVTFTELEHELAVSVEYSTELFDRSRVQRMIDQLERVLSAVLADPSLRLSELPLLSDGEREQLLAAGRGPERPYRADPAHVVIAEVAARTPQAVAAVFEDQQLTYAELDRRADRLARYLRSLGVGHQDVVAVALERGFDVLVALIGVLKAGAAFTVLDSGHPRNRLAFILDDAGAQIVLTRSELVDQLPDAEGRTQVCLDRDWERIEAAADHPLPEWASGDSLAYVLYTSGSTGKPKGVLIEHRALMLYVASFTAIFELDPADRLLQYASLVFDLSEAEIFSALTVGATLVLAPRDTLMSPTALADLIRHQRVSYVGAPPAMLALVEPGPYPDLRHVLVGGEAFSGDLVNRWNLPGRRFINGYGPTETTIGCTAYECEQIPWRSSPPIGRPLLHRRLYVVDRWGNLAPIGVPGELLIGGNEGLARGYLNQPQLTDERFIEDPFHPHARVYRSGDLVRWTEDLQLEFLGRIDSQIKLRGLRIELEEIETVLATHPHIDQTAVTLHQTPNGDKQLVAYITHNGTQPTTTDLRTHLARELPAYMIPSTWITLDTLPLAVSGKIDRNALPTPQTTPNHHQHTPPRTPTEHEIARIFADVLNHPNINTHDNFFELGGSSLQAIRVISRLTETFGTTLRVRDIYTATTAAALALQIEEARAAEARSACDVDPQHSLVPLKESGSRPPVFCVHPVSGSAYAYAGLAGALDPEQPVYGLEALGLEDEEPVLERLEDLAARYASAIQHQQPRGPFSIVGWSMGGVVAFEIARRLVGSGAAVSLVAAVDSPVPTGTEPPSEAAILRQFVHDLTAGVGLAGPELERLVEDADPVRRVERLLRELQRRGLLSEDVGVDFLQRRFTVFRANVLAIHRYRPATRYPGRLTLIRASASDNTVRGWADLADGVDDYVLDGDHYSIWDRARLPRLAELLEACLARGVGE
jgi:amino acid adenylation domain-containing protein